ncbi:MAG: hybrid sensor histidine kinase/response regulator [Magnetococcales bacterium]|nr:hybrid sensor histidine kinase/response regulator [Magnetococcales bacterium]MBF0156718.1 hybrid sensor histidine kinase/response regulator [Magnetococcales bacterium]
MAKDLREQMSQLIGLDLRNPLVTLTGLLEQLRLVSHPPLSGPQKNLLDRIVSVNGHLLDAMDRITSLCGLESEGRILKKQFLDARHVVAEATRKLGQLAEWKGVEIDNQVAEGTRLFAEPMLLGEVVYELLSNAIKFSHQGGVVEVSAHTEGEVVVVVRDYGIGIAPKDLASLAVTGELSTPEGGGSREPLDRRSRGRGFGLASCIRVMERHGGSLEMNSLLGRGSTFSLSLPVMEPRVMVVEDQAMDRDLFASYLEGLRVTVLPMENGRQALERLSTAKEEELPHLIVTDITMPEMDGFQLLEAITTDPRLQEIPVILVTGDESAVQRVRAFRLGAADFSVKPLVVEDFIPRVCRVLGCSL